MPQAKAHLNELFRTKSSEKSRRGLLRLDMNESVEGLPERFIKEVISEINPEFLSSYPEYYPLQNKIAEYNNLKPENICLSNGSDGAIKYIFDAFVSKGDKILLTDPTFAMYPVYCKMFNAEPVTIEYNSDLSFPLESFQKKMSDDIKIAVVVNPNNPTGSVVPPHDLIGMVKTAADNDVLMIIDEAYFYFYPESLIGNVEKYDNLIILRTFSKLCGLAALRLGYVAASPGIIENLRKVKPTFDVNGMAVLFAEKLINNPDIIKILIENTNRGKQYLIDKLLAEQIEHKAGHGNFILIKCNEMANDIMKRLAEKGILVNGGFKQSFLKDYIRVTVGSQKTMGHFWKSFIAIWNNKENSSEIESYV